MSSPDSAEVRLGKALALLTNQQAVTELLGTNARGSWHAYLAEILLAAPESPAKWQLFEFLQTHYHDRGDYPYRARSVIEAYLSLLFHQSSPDLVTEQEIQRAAKMVDELSHREQWGQHHYYTNDIPPFIWEILAANQRFTSIQESIIPRIVWRTLPKEELRLIAIGKLEEILQRSHDNFRLRSSLEVALCQLRSPEIESANKRSWNNPSMNPLVVSARAAVRRGDLAALKKWNREIGLQGLRHSLDQLEASLGFPFKERDSGDRLVDLQFFAAFAGVTIEARVISALKRQVATDFAARSRHLSEGDRLNVSWEIEMLREIRKRISQ